jgi:predicted Zn finger-like uncharacterized protein
MIVQCGACQTKFRVPDDKIGDKPVKVRCSRCAHIFPVTRADGTAEGPPLPVSALNIAPRQTEAVPLPAESDPFAAIDPFAEFGPAQPHGDVTSPGIYHAGIAATRVPASLAPREETKPGLGVVSALAAKMTGPASTVAPRQPSPSPSSTGPHEDPFADLNFDLALGPAPATDLMPRVPPTPVPVKMNSRPASQPGMFSRPPSRSSPAALAAPPLPPAPLEAESDPFAKLDLVAPPPRPAETLTPSADDPFAKLDLGAARPNRETPAPRAPPPPPPPDLFGHLNLPPPPPVPPMPDPFAGLDLGAVVSRPPSGPMPTVTGSVLPPPPPAAALFSDAPSGLPTGLSGAALPGPDSGGLDDFFGSTPAAQAQDNPHGGDYNPDAHAEPDRSLFDLPAAAPVARPAQPSSPGPAPGSEPLTPLVEELNTRAAQPRLYKPPAAPTLPEGPPLRSRLVSAGVQVAVMAGVAYATAAGYAASRRGHLDPVLLQPKVLLQALSNPATGPAAQLTLSDVSQGYYPLANNRAAFYVRGVLTNTGPKALGPARVKVEVLESGMGAEGWAGKPISPARLHAVASDVALKTLQGELKAEAEPIPPGEQRAFIAVMLNYPDDLASKKLRVTPELP